MNQNQGDDAGPDPPKEYESELKGHNIRLFLAKALVENLMGPRGGPEERIKNPGFQYVVGVLKTAFREASSAEPMPPDDPGMEDVSVERHRRGGPDKYDEELYVHEDGPVSADQDLNPVLGARSMGISFVASGNPPSISVCATWGRYEKQPGEEGFKRIPNFYTAEIKPDRNMRIPMECGTGEDRNVSSDGAVLVVNSLPVKGSRGMYKVSVFLVNMTGFKGHPTVAEDMFQPQIRINVTGRTRLATLKSVVTDDTDPSDRILLDRRRVLASGHFCGALWKEVDPEDGDMHGFGAFTWADSKSPHFPEDLRKGFTRPDMRTEYFPSYSILQPEIPDRADLDADVLAETWDSESMAVILTKMSAGYEGWISGQEEQLGEMPPELREAGAGNVAKCRGALARIKGGIRLLKDDERARAAFCFMNKVMATKSGWESGPGGRGFSWHEFQMAFILHCLEGVAQKKADERDVCDVLWFPTGGGKTEAYLGLMTFAIAYRRLTARDDFATDGGVSVISRYTLRLLTLQQFQRTIGAVVAADFLRVTKWAPEGIGTNNDALGQKRADGTLWGRKRFSIGLWIGGGATPNKFPDTYDKKGGTPVRYAEGMLKDDKKGNTQDNGDPTQVNFCPCCNAILSVPASEEFGLDRGSERIFWIFISTKTADELNEASAEDLGSPGHGITVTGREVHPIKETRSKRFYCIELEFKYTGSESHISGSAIRNWWNDVVSVRLGGEGRPASIYSTAPTRPGYFFVSEQGEVFDFVIHCPNPKCGLNRGVEWFEDDPDVPSPYVPEPFSIDGRDRVSSSIPISAYTVDTQIYARCPTVIIATVDKFAILPYRNDASGIFGNVDVVHERFGYGRSPRAVRGGPGARPIVPLAPKETDLRNRVRHTRPFLPPSLIIQDELHLIEGPLGSRAGIYEVGTEILSSAPGHRPKYVASSATIKKAESQVGCIFRRPVSVFPPTGVSVGDNYFSRSPEDVKSTGGRAGRLYMGISSPNKVLILPVRIWGTLLGEVHRIRGNPERYNLDEGFREDGRSGETFGEYVERVTDPYWTLVGYFSAIRELQVVRGLYDDNIKEFIRNYRPSGGAAPGGGGRPQSRDLGDPMELTGQTDSQDLPHHLQILNARGKTDAVFTTAVFGTGIDIPRLGLMAVMGQPKTTSTYIQSTGRVGREADGLVVVWLKSSNIRDLSHYENFVGYHRLLQNYVEPMSASPYSEPVMRECLGPICVSILRNARIVGGAPVDGRWLQNETKQGEGGGPMMMKDYREFREVEALISEISRIATDPNIPGGRAVDPRVAGGIARGVMERWHGVASDIARDDGGLAYVEWTIRNPPTKNVVLGTPQHEFEKIAVYRNSRTSMREVEPQATFGDD